MAQTGGRPRGSSHAGVLSEEVLPSLPSPVKARSRSNPELPLSPAADSPSRALSETSPCLRERRRRRRTKTGVSILVAAALIVYIFWSLRERHGGRWPWKCMAHTAVVLLSTVVAVTQFRHSTPAKYSGRYILLEWFMACASFAIFARRHLTGVPSTRRRSFTAFAGFLFTWLVRVGFSGRTTGVRLEMLEVYGHAARIGFEVLEEVVAVLFGIVVGLMVHGFGHAFYMLHRTVRSVTRAGYVELVTEAKKARLEVALQIVCITGSALTSMANALHFLFVWGGIQGLDQGWRVVSMLDKVMHLLCFVMLTGMNRLVLSTNLVSQEEAAEEARLERRCVAFQKGWLQAEGTSDAWWEKVDDLACRGVTLRAILKFWRGLGQEYMHHFAPSAHTTCDVVRWAIIPLSSEARCDYAFLMMDGERVRPRRLVTHVWSDLFIELVAGICADALGETSAVFVCSLLELDVDALERMLLHAGVLDETVWVCIFAVNQHTAICAHALGQMADTVTREPYPLCGCGLRKFSSTTPPLREDGNSICCEMNKFDDVMSELALEPTFEQVIVVDWGFKLFSRAWCVAELVRAYHLGMNQRLVIPCSSQLQLHKAGLRGLRVQDMQASRPEDVEQILARIPDKEAFNSYMQDFLFHSGTGMISRWKTLDGFKRLQHCGRMARWEAVTGHIPFWESVMTREHSFRGLPG